MVLSSSIRRALFATCVIAILAGCSGGLTPPQAAGSSVGFDAGLGPSWMDPSAVHRRLLYVSGSATGSSKGAAVYVFGYDNPTKVVGKLTGFSEPAGECTDKAGDVFITDTYLVTGRVVEYRHGGTKPIATFDDAYNNPDGCAVDPTSGELAVSNDCTNSFSTPGSVAIYKYKNPSHRPKTYGLPYGCPAPPAYDAAGNLFTEGLATPSGLKSGLQELPFGAGAFKKITLQGATINGDGGGVGWDGRYITLTIYSYSSSATGLYRVEVSGSVATVVGKVLLTDSCGGKTGNRVYDPWIEGNVVSGGNNFCNHRFDYWNYAAGGGPLRSIPRDIAPATSSGEAVSE